MKKNKYKIFISTFGERVIKVKGGIPIEVGSLKNKNKRYPLHDDIGENISLENDYFGEMTGIYWIWKNLDISDDDIIGFCHYNKALDISQGDAKKWLGKNPTGFIVLNPSYAKCHEASDEVNGIEAALKHYSEDYRSWCVLYDEKAASRKRSCYSCNMFIATGKSFKEFCSWIFPILFEMRRIVGDKPYVSLNLRRYCAFMGERLLTVYVKTRKLPVLCVSKRIRNWWVPYLYPIFRYVPINHNNRFFKYFRDKIGNGSSYR